MLNYGRRFSRHFGPARAFSATLALALTLGSATALAADEEVGRLALASGDVRVSKTPTDPGKPIAAGAAIHNTDIIKTGEKSAAKVLFSDRSIMELGADSALKISDFALNSVEDRTGVFSLMYGKLRAAVTKKVGPAGKIEVRSADVVMGVRGTEFMVDAPRTLRGAAEPPKTTILVASGTVQVTPASGGPPVFVTGGRMMTVGPRPGQGGNKSTGDAGSESAATGASSSDAASGTATASESGVTTAAATGTTADAATTSVVSVSAAQIDSFMGTTKAEDTTFLGSVTMGTAATGTDSGTAVSLLGTMLGDSALPPPTDMTTVSMAPPPGVTVDTNFLPPVSIVPGNPVQLTVIIQ